MLRLESNASETGFERAKASTKVGGGGAGIGTGRIAGCGLPLGGRTGGGMLVAGSGLARGSGTTLASLAATNAGDGPTDFSVLTAPAGEDSCLPAVGICDVDLT